MCSPLKLFCQVNVAEVELGVDICCSLLNTPCIQAFIFHVLLCARSNSDVCYQCCVTTEPEHDDRKRMGMKVKYTDKTFSRHGFSCFSVC